MDAGAAVRWARGLAHEGLRVPVIPAELTAVKFYPRTWRERLFTRPWQPRRRYRGVREPRAAVVRLRVARQVWPRVRNVGPLVLVAHPDIVAQIPEMDRERVA